jgi:hypothetical protein
MDNRVAALTSKTARATPILAACVLSLVLTSEASASVAVAATGSVRQELKNSLTAATDAGSARITVQFFSGSTTGKVVQDSSLDSCKQTVAVGKGRASTLLTGGAAYLSGNSAGMTSYFGLPSTLIQTLAGRWISVQATDAAFESVTANLSLPAALAEVTPSGKLVAGKRLRVRGQNVRSIAGTAPGGGGRLTLFVAADARSLPVQAVESQGSGTSARGEIVTFSRWGEPVHVSAPTGAVPISVLEPASSASG